MIRYVFIAAMLGVLFSVLYIPSAVPADKILAVMRAEHEVTGHSWGPDAADRILARMLDMQQSTASISTPPQTTTGGAPNQVNTAVATHIEQVSTQLFGNSYFRSIDSLFVLVTYRVSTIVELAPVLLAFLIAVAGDGLALRAVRAKELIPHSAELFAVSVIGAILLASVVAVGCFLPFQLPPALLVSSLLAMLFVSSRAIANYHLFR